MAIINEVEARLRELVAGDAFRFMTYGEFGRAFGLGNFPPSWANRTTLDTVSKVLKADPNIGLDLTFMLRSSDTHYPSVIDGEPFDKKFLRSQTLRARDEAQKIIDRFNPGFPNPY